MTYSANISRADVSDPNDLLALVATWPEVWRDHFAEREAIMAVDASHPFVPAIRESLEDVVRVAELRTPPPPFGEKGEEVGHTDVAVIIEVGWMTWVRTPGREQCE